MFSVRLEGLGPSYIMASMLDTLPQPSRNYERPEAAKPAVSATSAAVYAPPPYGRRKNFKPTHVEDFGDGGAFPEIPMDQFPLGMGRPDTAKTIGSTLAVTVSGDGTATYDAIVKQGANRLKVVHTGLKAIVPKIDNLHEVCNKFFYASHIAFQGGMIRASVCCKEYAMRVLTAPVIRSYFSEGSL